MLGSAALAAADAGLRVVSLYDQQSIIPGALIPFRVSGTLVGKGALKAVTVVSPADNSCRAMVDPFAPTDFHLKCVNESDVQLRVSFAATPTEVYEVNYGPISVRKPFSNVIFVDPQPDPTEDPSVLAGQQLFGAHCIGCHAEAKAKAGRTATLIRNAVNSVGDMRSLAPLLQSADYDRLAAYLGSL